MKIRTFLTIAACLLAMIGPAGPAQAQSDICRLMAQRDAAAASRHGADLRKVTRTYSNGDYVGQVVDGKRCGDGAFYFDSGTIHAGLFVDNRFFFGAKQFANGRILFGQYDDAGKLRDTDRRSRERSIIIDIGDEGAIYVGELRGGKRAGSGKVLSASDNVLRGDFRDGRPNGQATSCNETHGYVYEGGYRDGRRHGEGGIRYHSDYLYEGVWENGDTRFGVGIWKGEQSVFYRRNGDFKVSSTLDWCERNGFKGVNGACLDEIGRRARLDNARQMTTPSASITCAADRAELKALREQIRTELRNAAARRP